MSNEDKITRFEVIDDTGRVLVRHPVRLWMSYQDDNRTLKVFLRYPDSPKPPEKADD